MLGGIIGDICGSIYEWRNRKTENPDEIDLVNPKCRFTDDSVLTVAVADACLGERDYRSALKDWGTRYLDAGYGGSFRQWLVREDADAYNSWGNGSAMRVGPVGWAFDTLEETLDEARRSAEVTHNHPEGVKGAQAVAAAIFLARSGRSKAEIGDYIKKSCAYDLDRSLNEIRPDYEFDVSCQGSVPEALIAFFESRDYAHAIRLAISIGGDSDTIACITGSVAEAFYREIPAELGAMAWNRVTHEMRLLIHAFLEKYTLPSASVFTHGD
ncbi:MAG: ADP-ribosylglycohydrolase family protein [Candidatus Accumulibacter sp.]|nr:ADP-ribosylglycohydrolase family protein [Accumulibacter sp.]